MEIEADEAAGVYLMFQDRLGSEASPATKLNRPSPPSKRKRGYTNVLPTYYLIHSYASLFQESQARTSHPRSIMSKRKHNIPANVYTRRSFL